MRIFIILPRVPYPLEKGDKLRAFHQIRELSKNHELILCALNHDRKLDKQQAFKKLQPYCRSINFIDLPFYALPFNIMRAFFKRLPLQVGYFYNGRAAEKIKKLYAEYRPDHVYCQLVRTAEYGRLLPGSKTLDYQDVFSYGVKRRIKKAPFWLKPVLQLEYHRLVRYEQRVFDMFDVKTIISEPDRKLMPHPRKEEIHIIRNGVDHDFFKPLQQEKKYHLVFTGNMSYPPNVDAAGFLIHEIMPLVWEKIPEARVMLAGASPDAKVKTLAKEKVAITGWIPDIRSAYASAQVFIAPMRIGTGLQNKLLEAMSMKTPSITTPLANDALKARPGKDILVGETAEQLADAVIRLLTDKVLAKNIAESGYAFVHVSYSWHEATAKLERLMQHAATKDNKSER